MDRPEASPLDRVRHSLFRTRTDSDPAVVKKRRLSDIFLTSRTKQDGGEGSNPSIGASSEPTRKASQPLNNHTTSPFIEDPYHYQNDHSFAHEPPLPSLNNVHMDDGARYVAPPEPNSQIMSDGSAMDERAMQRRLLDLESSFVPDRSSYHESEPQHQAGTRTPYQTSPVKSLRPASAGTPRGRYVDNASARSWQPSTYSRSPSSQTPTRNPAADSPSHSPMSLRQLLSSPTAAAAQRTRLRQASRNFDLDSPTKSQPQITLSPTQSVLHTRKGDPQANAAYLPDAGDSSAEDQNNSEISKPGKPEYLQQYESSQRSSMSSVHSEAATGVEMNGVDTPISRAAVRQSRELSRLPSFGSMASSMSGGNAETVVGHVHKPVANRNNLERLVEEERQKSESPATPRAATYTEAPTNTVLTRHVQNIRVPDTVRRDFTSNSYKTDDGSTPFLSRPRTNLTLKEQNSRIDKLGKENFDLKLKIHYLHQALQDRSDEGVKDMVSKNAQLQADLVKSRKENQTLRKRVRELERARNETGNEGPASRSNYDLSEDDNSSRSVHQAQLEEEIYYLREQMRHLEGNNEQMRQDLLSREVEKRDLAEQVMQLTHVDDVRVSDVSAAAYQQLLDSEVSRREIAEAREKELLDEITRLTAGRSAAAAMKAYSSHPNMRNGEAQYQTPSLSGTTAVDQLRMENAELQRALGAQTSMLTSRNKERERLQQEIEDLKLVHRRGEGSRSNAGDSLFDRSVSRANQRPTSRHSSTTRVTQLSDPDREQYEATQGNLRDENAMLKMRNQDLLKEINSFKDSTQVLEAELAEVEARADEDRVEAQNLIDQLEDMVDERQQDIDQLRIDLEAGERDATTLKRDNESMSERLGRLLGNAESTQATVENLRQDLNNANGALESTEKALREATSAKERLEVQAESSQNEISFLREEQEGDKIKISELQSSLRAAKTNLRDEKDRLQELEELESAATKAREEARRLKKSLTAKEVELASSNDQLEEYDGSLRKALGITNGSIQAMVKEVMKQQRDLENALQELDETRAKHAQREKQVSDRDALLESSGLETRRLAEQLSREKQARKHDQNAFEKWQRTLGADSSRQDKKKMLQLEQQFTEQVRDRNDLLLSVWTRLSDLCDPAWAINQESATMETVARDLPGAKKTILTALNSVETTLNVTRDHIHTTEKELTQNYRSLEAELDSRSKRVTELEQLVAASASRQAARGTPEDAAELSRMRNEIKQLRKELKFLKQSSLALPGLPTSQEEQERAPSRHANAAPSRFPDAPLSAGATLPSSRGFAPNNGDVRYDSRKTDRPRERDSSALQRHASSSQVLDSHSAQNSNTAINSSHAGSGSGSDSSTIRGTFLPSEQVWLLRLRELQRRLRAEREGRELDRTGAVNRLEEQRVENEGLRQALERERQIGRLRYRESRRIERGNGATQSVRDAASDAGLAPPVNEQDVGRAISR